MISSDQRKQLDEALFLGLRTLFRFERLKVERFGLSYEGILLLQYLRRHPMSRMTAIAEEMRVPISTLTRLVDRLEKRGLISRQRDAEDMRKIRLVMETPGETIVQEIEDHTYKILVDNMENVKSEDFGFLLETALTVSKLLEIGSVELNKKEGLKKG